LSFQHYLLYLVRIDSNNILKPSLDIPGRSQSSSCMSMSKVFWSAFVFSLGLPHSWSSNILRVTHKSQARHLANKVRNSSPEMPGSCEESSCRRRSNSFQVLGGRGSHIGITLSAPTSFKVIRYAFTLRLRFGAVTYHPYDVPRHQWLANQLNYSSSLKLARSIL
jgi:hypothetical protein